MQFPRDPGLLVPIPRAGLNCIKSQQSLKAEEMTSPCTHASSRSPGMAEGTRGCIFYLPYACTINNVTRSTLFKSRSCATVRCMSGHAGQQHGLVPASPLANEAPAPCKHNGLVPRAVHAEPGGSVWLQKRRCPIQARPGVGCGSCGGVVGTDLALPPQRAGVNRHTVASPD